MPYEIVMPQLGLTMENGLLLDWLVEKGEPIRQGQGIFEVETDKAAVVVEAHEDGIIERILVRAGEIVPVGATVAVAVKHGETLPPDWAPVGDRTSDPIQTATAEVEPQHEDAGPAGGRPKARVRASWKARAMCRKIDLELASIAGSGPGGRIVAADVSRALQEHTGAGPVQVEASPVATNLAASLGLDLSGLAGSGLEGRIEKADVIEAAATVIRGQLEAPPGAEAAALRVSRKVPLVGVRGTVSERMASSARATARVTMFREVDAAALIDLRQRYYERGIEVSYNDLLVRICAAALREHPEANARLGEGAIEWLQEVHIGLAVDTDKGLLVPVVHNADTMSLAEIAQESQRLIRAAREGQCTPVELTGGTFTISNLGMLGVEGFTPVINLPECSILGIGRILRKPVVIDEKDTVAVRPMMMLSLAFDHRVIDGAPAARFLDRIAESVVEPRLLL